MNNTVLGYGITEDKFIEFLNTVLNYSNKIQKVMDDEITSGFCTNISVLWYSPKAVEYMTNNFSPRYMKLQTDIYESLKIFYSRMYSAYEAWEESEGLSASGVSPTFSGNIYSVSVSRMSAQRTDGFVGIVNEQEMKNEVTRFDTLIESIKQIFHEFVNTYESFGTLLYGSNGNGISKNIEDLEAHVIAELTQLKDDTVQEIQATLDKYKTTAETVEYIITNPDSGSWPGVPDPNSPSRHTPNNTTISDK